MIFQEKLKIKPANAVTLWAGVLAATLTACAQEARIEVHADQVMRRVSRYLTGACIEDVNHEIYGGLFSQMIFGESFQEPARPTPPKGFKAFGGTWQVRESGELWAGSGDGPKLIREQQELFRGEAGVEVFLPDRRAGNAGLIIKVGQPGMGADNFDGYEISLDAAQQVLRLGRHRHNWEHIKDTPCPVPTSQWISLVVTMTEQTLDVLVNGARIIQYEDREHPLRSGAVGLRQWQREARYRNLWVKTGERAMPLPFERGAEKAGEISALWRAVVRGSATGRHTLETERPFSGKQSQRLTFASGAGVVGIENRSLNRWGMCFVKNKPYEGCVWARAEKPCEIFVALENRDGATVYAEQRLKVTSNDWQRLNFLLRPNTRDDSGRFAIMLKQPGSVVLGHAFLQPGEWGRFKGLPVRRDVSEALVAQGITVLRYGGSMINHPEYRWKQMIGPRDRRPPYRGTWYPHSSNGWGILDFLNFCEAAGFLGIPAFNMDETPRDMADFIAYANEAADSEWGRKRRADGHPAPYQLRYLQLGNEERVDENYFQKFKLLAEALWEKDPRLIIVVGDFLYTEPIRDSFNFKGAAAGITSLAAHQKILALAKARNREVWFDVHVGTEGPGKSAELSALPSYLEALQKISDGAKHQVVVFEFNAGNHQHRRALANAQAIHLAERLGLPIATSANCLQPDGQNDNGWNQGLLFLNPAQVWLQPPGYVTRMVSFNDQPELVRTEVQSPDNRFDVNGKRSEDGKTLVLQVVNLSEKEMLTAIHLNNFKPAKATAQLETLSGPLNAVNTAESPLRLVPQQTTWRHELSTGAARYTFPAHSFTVMRFN